MRERYVMMVTCLFISGISLLVIGVLNCFIKFIDDTGGYILISGVILCISSLFLFLVINKKR